MDRLRGSIGLKIEQELRKDEEEKKGDEVDMLDEEGHIQYRKLNTALLRKYKNPFRILYLWAVQETLEVQSIREAFKLKGELEEKRNKLMKKIKMTKE